MTDNLNEFSFDEDHEDSHPLARLVDTPLYSQQEILRMQANDDAMQHVRISPHYVRDALTNYPQFGQLAEALFILEWYWDPKSRTFINKDYGVGYQIVDGSADPRMTEGFMILGKDDPPVKACPFDVYRLRKQPESDIWTRDSSPDEWYLKYTEGEDNFNAGSVLEHSAVMAMNMATAPADVRQYVVNMSFSHATYISHKAFCRAVWRANGYPTHEFKDAWTKLHASSE